MVQYVNNSIPTMIETFENIKKMLKRIGTHSVFYKEKFKDIDLESINSWDDFRALPFTDKDELRNSYPMGLQGAPDEEIVRIHSTSGTTGIPVIIPYTAQDVEDWTYMFARCYTMAGVSNRDRVHITPGYGLWTAGIGFQAGAEKLGALAIPMGPGNTDKQLKMMIDMESTVLCATSSYALLLAEEITARNLSDKIKLRSALIGSERWGAKMRTRISNELGAKIYDIYGLTEVYGPGVAVSCDERSGMHYWSDFVYFEIIDPKTGELLPDGEIGELVITTFKKEGAPLIRYRTHDLTKIMTGDCACGCKFPRIHTLSGRTDDMTKVKGVNIFPAQIDRIIQEVEGASSEYQVMIDHLNGKDIMTIYFEINDINNKKATEHSFRELFKTKIGIQIVPKAVSLGELPRSEKKTTRIYDNRY